MELINGKTAEEIKSGLQACKRFRCGEDCPYGEIKHGCMGEMLNNAFALIERLEAQIPRWISVYDALPAVGETLVVLCGRVCIAWHHGMGRFESPSGMVWSAPEVELWMPLPEPPKEDLHDAV